MEDCKSFIYLVVVSRTGGQLSIISSIHGLINIVQVLSVIRTGWLLYVKMLWLFLLFVVVSIF